jgi:hypothetical protein
MLYLRTAYGTFINAGSIVELTQHGDQPEVWVAIRSDGQEVPLARYYSAPGRIERELPHLLPRREAVVLPSRHASRAAAVPAADCSAAVCCCASV